MGLGASGERETSPRGTHVEKNACHMTVNPATRAST